MSRVTILDVGCRTGLLAVAAVNVVGHGGYLGLDVSARDIAACRSLYRDPRLRFERLAAANDSYAPHQRALVPWPVADASQDMVTALSVWTWFVPSTAAVPEAKIGLTPKAIEMMREATSLELVRTYPGLWKDVGGPYYQDVLVFRKTAHG